MAKRKSITKKTRFEVFKRDSFKCQYCGRTSPDVLLEVDHIKPVADGGTNDITNLITACFDCNRGKSDRLLDDNSVLEKQRKQLEELNERRNQLEMMMKWRESLQELDNSKIKIFTDQWDNLTGYSVNEHGMKTVKRLVKKYDLNFLLDCMETSVNQYLEADGDGDYTHKSVEKTFKYIERICATKTKVKDKPYLKDLFYIRGILKNRLSYFDPHKSIALLEEAYSKGASIESLKDLAVDVKNWSEFKNEILYFINNAGDDDE